MKKLQLSSFVAYRNKLTQEGILHHMLPLMFVVLFAVIGVGYLVDTHAATPVNETTGVITSGYSNRCLDNWHRGTSAGNKVDLYGCNKTVAQNWEVYSNSTIRMSGLCLATLNNAKTSGAKVVLASCSASTTDVWTSKANGNLYNSASKECLTATSNTAGVWLVIDPCTAVLSEAQQWHVPAVNVTTPTPTPTPTPTSTASYTVSGNLIKNSSGQTVIVHGVDRPSLEWSCSGTTITGAGTGIPASDFATMRNDWNANAVRIPLDQDRWLTGAAQYCSTYKATVEAAVQEAEANKMIVILDLHWSDQGDLANTASGQQCMPDQNSVTFWQQIATLYKNDPNVWFELYNEPYPPGSSQSAQWNTWLNGGSVTCTALVGGRTATWNAAGMQTLVNTVRATGAKNIVLAGGLAFSSVLAGAPTLTGGNVAYAVHPYDNGTSGIATASWNNNFGNQSAKAPVIATEFGDKVCGDASYDNGILSYFKSHDVGFTGWAWYAGGCTFPSLVNAQGTCAVSMGCTIQSDMKTYSTTPYSD